MNNISCGHPPNIIFFILILILADPCSGSTFWINATTESALNTFHTLLSQHKNRYKREAVGTDVCALQCISRMSKGMGKLAQTTAGLIQSELFNKKQLDSFCGIYRRGKRCLQKCGDTAIIDALMAAFSALDYLCITHYVELVGYLECFKESEMAVKGECDPHCGGMSQLRRLQERQQKAQQQRDLQETTSVLGKMCRQLDCETACQQPIIQRICQNPFASRFMRNFAQGSLRPLQKMMVDMGGGKYWPESCRALASSSRSILIAGGEENSMFLLACASIATVAALQPIFQNHYTFS